MGKSTTPSFVVNLRLLTTKEDEQELEYRFRVGTHLYNLCVKEAQKRAHKLLKDAEYKARRKVYSGAKEERDTLLEIRARYGLAGSYSLESYIKEGRKKFAKHLDSDTCAKISQTVWSATADFLFKDGEQIHFKKVRDFRSMESKTNKQGILFKGTYVKWRGLHIPVRVRKKDVYAKQCLQNHRIKYCRIHRKWHKHKWRYYVELVMEGIPPLKERRMGKGRVGIDIGTSTITAVSETDVLFKELNDGIESIDREIRCLNRKADRQRRANNPDNYNENGTIKKDKKGKTNQCFIQIPKCITDGNGKVDKTKYRLVADFLSMTPAQQNVFYDEFVANGKDMTDLSVYKTKGNLIDENGEIRQDVEKIHLLNGDIVYDTISKSLSYYSGGSIVNKKIHLYSLDTFNKKIEQESPDFSQERNALFLFLYQLLSVLVPDVLFYNLFAHVSQSTHVVTVAP